MKKLLSYLFPFILFSLSACGNYEKLKMDFSLSPHEKYIGSLKKADLLETAIGKSWIEASEKALADALPVKPPYKDSGTFNQYGIDAKGYRIELKRGQKLLTSVSKDADSVILFMDLFRIEENKSTQIQFAKDSLFIEKEIFVPGTYVLRLQPELLAHTKYSVSIKIIPTFAFPVAGKDSRAVQSFMGAKRDGGKRKHEGIDIFARQGTPVVAATDGVVRRVGISKLGGNYIFLRDTERNISLYYAHLKDRFVTEGQQVSRYDTLGTVGNTGNARFTPPHLHFGVYEYGAIDPYPFVNTNP